MQVGDKKATSKMKPGPNYSPKKRMCKQVLAQKQVQRPRRALRTQEELPDVRVLAATVASLPNQRSDPSTVTPSTLSSELDQSVEQKRLLIRKQLVILLHAIVCRRRDLIHPTREGSPAPQVNMYIFIVF